MEKVVTAKQFHGSKRSLQDSNNVLPGYRLFPSDQWTAGVDSTSIHHNHVNLLFLFGSFLFPVNLIKAENFAKMSLPALLLC